MGKGRNRKKEQKEQQQKEHHYHHQKDQQQKSNNNSLSFNNSNLPSNSSNTTTQKNNSNLNNGSPSSDGNNNRKNNISFIFGDWYYKEKNGIVWFLSCVLLGFLVGIGIGTGYFTGAYGTHSQWRHALGSRVRSSIWYRILMFDGRSMYIDHNYYGSYYNQNMGCSGIFCSWRRAICLFFGLNDLGSKRLYQSTEQRAFYALREMIIREKGGIVHPDLGLLIPAPSGAPRGLGMIHSSYMSCQRKCRNKPTAEDDILIKIPYEIQMTRSLALQTLLPLLPHEVRRRAPLEELDDAALLVLLLSHEKSKGHESRFDAYIQTLPKEPTCGYSLSYRARALHKISFLGQELGMDVNGWHAELLKASEYAERIAAALTRDYGVYVVSNLYQQQSYGSASSSMGNSKSATHSSSPNTVNSNAAFPIIQWALCQVTSRATAANDIHTPNGGHSGLRLIPLLDFINHDVDAAGFYETSGDERISKGDFFNAKQSDQGSFIIRSFRHGRRKILSRGQELMANYNVPYYSPLDWFINLGFVPPERSHRWVKLDNGLPKFKLAHSFHDTIPNSDTYYLSPEL